MVRHFPHGYKDIKEEERVRNTPSKLPKVPAAIDSFECVIHLQFR